MRSLFTKILLWFLLTTILSITGSFYIWNTFQRQQPPNQFNGRAYELHEARQAWEKGGREGLAAFEAQFKEYSSGGEAILTDGSGKDLLTGRDWSADIASSNPGRGGGRGPMSPFIRIEGGHAAYFVSPTRSRDGEYIFLAKFPSREPARAGVRVDVPDTTWWMLGFIAAFCYILARNLTSPLRNMQKTVERFGKGDFSARVKTRRGDELGQLGRTVDQMADRIDLLMKAQRRLLQDISHELRSPLARLGVAVELARGGGDPGIALNRVEREADRLNTLVGELIQVTRAEGDPAGLATETVRLDELVQTILDDVHIEAEKRQVILRPAMTACEMEGSPELLRRAFENIIRNAIRYSPEGTQVDVTLTRAQNTFVVSVRDYGEGVPEESLASIFDPFYRVEKDRGRTSGGVGLGLAIAKRAVELHHGLMSATNVHPGLRVDIELPATPATHSGAASDRPSHQDSLPDASPLTARR
jgi:two-component system sensor histidine kinase CpxA